jgi:hypothetical protein
VIPRARPDVWRGHKPFSPAEPQTRGRPFRSLVTTPNALSRLRDHHHSLVNGPVHASTCINIQITKTWNFVLCTLVLLPQLIRPILNATVCAQCACCPTYFLLAPDTMSTSQNACC